MRTNFLFFEGTSIDVVQAELEKAGLQTERVYNAVKIVLENEFTFGKKVVVKQIPNIVAAVVRFEKHGELLDKLRKISYSKDIVFGDNNRKGLGLESEYFHIVFSKENMQQAIQRWISASRIEEENKNTIFVEGYFIDEGNRIEGYSFYNPYCPNSLDIEHSFRRWEYSSRGLLARMGFKTSLQNAGVYRLI